MDKSKYHFQQWVAIQTTYFAASAGRMVISRLLLHPIHIHNGITLQQQLAHRDEFIALGLGGFNEGWKIFLDFVAVVVTQDDAAGMQLG